MAAMISGRFLDDYHREAPILSDLDHLPAMGTDLDITEAWQGERFRGLSITFGKPLNSMSVGDLAPGAAASWLADDRRSAVIIVEARYGNN